VGEAEGALVEAAATPPENKVAGVIDDAEDNYPNAKNSLGRNKLIGDGRTVANLTNDDGSLAGRSGGGYSHEDAYTGKHGHYYLGPSRRRIGAGFGRRRAGDPDAYPGAPKDDEGQPTLPPHLKERQEECMSQELSTTTTVLGLVTSVAHPNKPVKGMEVRWVNYLTDEVHQVHSDRNGRYQITLPRCSFYTHQYVQKGFVDDTGLGGCTDPILLEEKEEFWTAGVSEVMPKTELRAMLTWKANKKYLQDLDLHMLIPGERRVYFPKYKDLHNASPEQIAQMNKEAKVLEKHPNLPPNHTAPFTATNVAAHPDDTEVLLEGGPDDFNMKHHIFWDNLGGLDNMPFTQYEYDHGAEGCFDCHDMAGGPESIHIGKLMHKQYLVFVGCYSCEHNSWGGDRELTETALYEFAKSQAIVRVAQGSEQIYCRSIGTTPHRPTVRWDTVVLQCPRGIDQEVRMEVNGGGSKIEAVEEQLNVNEHLCTPHDINTYNLEARTIETVQPLVPHGAFKGDTVVTTNHVVNVTIYGVNDTVAGPEAEPVPPPPQPPTLSDAFSHKEGVVAEGADAMVPEM